MVACRVTLFRSEGVILRDVAGDDIDKASRNTDYLILLKAAVPTVPLYEQLCAVAMDCSSLRTLRAENESGWCFVSITVGLPFNALLHHSNSVDMHFFPMTPLFLPNIITFFLFRSLIPPCLDPSLWMSVWRPLCRVCQSAARADEQDGGGDG